MFGPGLLGDKDGSSAKILETMMTTKAPGLPKISVPIVDVVDCAQAFVRAAKVAEAANQRFIVVKEAIWLVELAEALK